MEEDKRSPVGPLPAEYYSVNLTDYTRRTIIKAKFEIVEPEDEEWLTEVIKWAGFMIPIFKSLEYVTVTKGGHTLFTKRSQHHIPQYISQDTTVHHKMGAPYNAWQDAWGANDDEDDYKGYNPALDMEAGY